MKLIDKLKKTTLTDSKACVFSESDYLDRNFIDVKNYALNIALSGDLFGGIQDRGILGIAGPSKHFKSMYAAIIAAGWLKSDPDAVVLFYDSEFGTSKVYMENAGINKESQERILHVPITNIEELKFDLSKKLGVGSKNIKNDDAISESDKVLIIIDSIGNLASLKETEDAGDQKTVEDMSRAKKLKSLFRIITPKLILKRVPLIFINHTYSEQGLFPKTIMSGGQGPLLSANDVWFVRKSKEKEGQDLTGFNFNILIDKSRMLKEGSVIPFNVKMNEPINKYSGLLDIALDLGFVYKPANGWYSVNLYTVDDNGQIVDNKSEQKFRKKDTMGDEFWMPLINHEFFNTCIKKHYTHARGQSDE